jgi:hypothetical protein
LPGVGLRGRIVALPGQRGSGIWWQGIAAAILGIAALGEIVTSARPEMPGGAVGEDQEAIAARVRQLDLPLTDAECRRLARETAAGAQLKALPPLREGLAMNSQMGGM